MRRFCVCILCLGAFAFFSCGSIPGSLTDAAGLAKNVTQSVAIMDFHANEVLCSEGDQEDAMDMYYRVAKVLTPASAETKQQSEVIFVSDGEKAWSRYVIPSRKAEKADLEIGTIVFVPNGWSEYKASDMSLDDYRQSGWLLVRVTSADELFKNTVEAGGMKYDIGLVRIPEITVE